jgi:hypothetical protein
MKSGCYDNHSPTQFSVSQHPCEEIADQAFWLPRYEHVGSRIGEIFISCVNLWRYFHLMGSPILT